MLLRRFYDRKLAQASYMIGCQRSGEAIVVDPARDVDQYLRAAAEEGVRVTHVTETHIHADFASGARELVTRAGARLFLSDEGGPDWRYAYAREAGATLLRDGDEIGVGNVRLRAMHTPGHTPEHLAFLVVDGAVTDEPMAILTGDFVFVGDVGRPDLLERAAHHEGTMEQAARDLFRSLARFRELPDYLQLLPGHGAGSACGKALGAVPQSTVGYEKRFNWALRIDDEATFVREVLAGQPEPPRYFAEMKRMNREGPPTREDGAAHPLSVAQIDALVAGGAVVVDVRPAAVFAAGHLPGALGIPLDKSFPTWAGALLPYDRPLVLVVDGDGAAAEAVRDLASIALDRVAGYATADALAGARGERLAKVAQVQPPELAGYATDEAVVVDVRRRSEWHAGHLPGARHVPLAELQARLDEVPRDVPVVLQCQGGARSAIAASVLQANGFRDVRNLVGGFAAWERAGLPVERERDDALAGAR